MDIDFFFRQFILLVYYYYKKNEVLFQSVPCYVQTIAILV